MKKEDTKNFLIITGSLFILVGILHSLRVIFSWQLIIGSFVVPITWSVIALITAFIFSFTSFKLSKK